MDGIVRYCLPNLNFKIILQLLTVCHNHSRTYSMKRNSFNSNLHIHQELTYEGYEIQLEHGLVVREYLDRVFGNMQRALDQYSRVCMIRFDLHVPTNCSAVALSSNILMSKFIASFRAKVMHSQAQSRKDGNRVHHTEVRFLWARELSNSERVHYHVAILLNNDAYRSIGKFNLKNDNMYARIHESWGSALMLHPADIQGLIHIPINPTYMIHREDDHSFQDAFFRASYLCKMKTKDYGQGLHTFGCSRI